jgi:hypothetical protein
VIADPFQWTAELVGMLVERAHQLETMRRRHVRARPLAPQAVRSLG